MFSRLLSSTRLSISRFTGQMTASSSARIVPTPVISNKHHVAASTKLIAKSPPYQTFDSKYSSDSLKRYKLFKVDNKSVALHKAAIDLRHSIKPSAADAKSKALSTFSAAESKFIDSRSDNPEFENLFTFIANDTKLSKIISKINPKDPKLQKLSIAIKSGDFENEMFGDPACDTYLLYLMKTKHISMSQGLGIYSYLNALMQFSKKQPLKETDQMMKFTRTLTMGTLVFNGRISEPGERYVKDTCENLSRLGYQIDSEDFKKFILNLPPSDATLLEIQCDFMNPLYRSTEEEVFAYILSQSIPFIYSQENSYGVPSIALIQYLLQKMSPSPGKMYFSFGIVSTDDALKLHEMGYHPVSLYSQHVASNLLEADNFKCGPFLMYLHDIGHTFWMSLLQPEQRRLLFTDLIHPLNKIVNRVKSSNEIAAEYVKALINQLQDFNLTPIDSFNIPGDRFQKYINQIFAKTGQTDLLVESEIADVYKKFLHKLHNNVRPSSQNMSCQSAALKR